jgi:WD40 repeat protein
MNDYPQNGYIVDFALSPVDGRVAFMEFGGLGFLDPHTGRRLDGVAAHELIRDAHFDEAGDLWFSGLRKTSPTSDELIVWRMAAPSELMAKPVTLDLPRAAGGGKVAAIADGRLKVWDVRSGREIFAIPYSSFNRCPAAFDSQGSRVAIELGEGKLQVFDLRSGKRIGAADDRSAPAVRVAMTQAGNIVSVHADGVVKVRTRALDRTLHEFRLPSASSIATSSDGRFLAIALEASTPESASEVRVVDLASGDTLQTLLIDAGAHEIALSADGGLAAVSSQSGRLTVWRVSSKELLYDWPLFYDCRPVFAPDGRHLATVNANGTAYILRMATPAQ